MSDTMILILFFVGIFILMTIVGFVGNKIVDKAENARRKRDVQKYNEAHKGETQNLADRYKK
jgi:hypothetical protein